MRGALSVPNASLPRGLGFPAGDYNHLVEYHSVSILVSIDSEFYQKVIPELIHCGVGVA
jgi:hypothetical protein